jgi:DNA repair protein RadC
MKPGRKLIEQGADRRSDQEILAILLGTGGPGYSAQDIADQVLEKHGDLARLMDLPLRELAAVKGLGPVKAIRIAAAYELARRIVKHLEHHT